MSDGLMSNGLMSDGLMSDELGRRQTRKHHGGVLRG